MESEKCFLVRVVQFMIILFLCSTGYARTLPDWPYEKLMDHADVVVIAEVVNAKEVDYDFSKDSTFGPLLKDGTLGPLIRPNIVAEITTLKVIHSLKGDCDDVVKVLHFRWKHDEPFENGPDFVEFNSDRRAVRVIDDSVKVIELERISAPQYLLFLKRTREGERLYVAVSGQFDPRLSVRLVLPP